MVSMSHVRLDILSNKPKKYRLELTRFICESGEILEQIQCNEIHRISLFKLCFHLFLSPTINLNESMGYKLYVLQLKSLNATVAERGKLMIYQFHWI